MTETPIRAAQGFRVRRTKWFYLLVASLVGLIVVPTSIYFSMSYNSVNGSTVQLTSVTRTVSHAPLSNKVNSVTYYVKAHVWSWAGSIDTRVGNPIFALTVDSFFISSQEGVTGTFKPYNYLSYSLSFTTLNSSVAYTLAQASSSQVVLAMTAPLSAGIYQNLVTVSDKSTWTFSE